MFKYLLSFFLLSSFFGFSQTSYNVNGKVVDAILQSPLESATVYFSKVSDSTVVDYTITDKNGDFSFKVKNIDYPVILKVSYSGYKENRSAFQNISKNHDLNSISLVENVATLNEVVVVSEIPPIVVKKDTLEFNASSFKVRPDANVESLLKQLPGVEIDSDGKITVNGKEVNQILVNGKPFFDKDGKIALQNLPSNIINKVQISDTKTVKEEKTNAAASSNNSSINLTIDEDKNKGFFGKIMGGYGTDERYESSAIVNYFKNKTKFSVLASSNNINALGFSMDEIFDNMGGGRNSSVWINGDGSFYLNGRSFGGNRGITQSNLVGLNYSDEWTKDTEISTNYFYSENNSKNTNRVNQTIFLPSGDFKTNSLTNSIANRFVHNFKTRFEFKIDSTASITIDPQFTKAINKNIDIVSQQSYDENNNLLNESNSDTYSDDEMNSFKNNLTFTKAFKRKGRYLSVEVENENSKTNNENQLISSTQFYQDTQPDDDRNQLNNSIRKNDKYKTELEFTEPITDSLKITISTEYLVNRNKDSRDVFDFDSGTNQYSISNDLLTNYFADSENTLIPKAGLAFQKKKYNLNLELGTSLVNFDAKSNYLNTTTNYSKDFLLPYVNAYGNFKFSKSKNLWINYSYRYSLPSANQVIPIQDLANPLNIKIGNPNLDINESHSLYFSYRNFDFATRSGYGFYSGGTLNASQIISTATYDANRKRTTTYDNVEDTYNSWLGLYWNKSFKKEEHKFRMEYRLNNNFGLSKGFTEGVLYSAKSYSFSPRVNLTYDYGEFLTINPTYNYSYNKLKYTNYVVDEASNFSHRFNVQVTNYWPKNWTVGNDFGYTYNSNIGTGFKKDFYLWNTSIAYSFFDKKLMAKVKVYDLLNQNVSATRSINASSITDEENVVLKRYLMFSLTYKIEKFGGKESKSRRHF